jgi:hypothetical protein
VNEKEQQLTPDDADVHTFVVYDAESGDLVHGHRAVVLPSKEDAPGEKDLIEHALQTAAEVTGRKPDGLRALAVSEEDFQPGFVYRVDPKSERLERVEGEEAAT